MIELQALSKRYGDTLAVDDLPDRAGRPGHPQPPRPAPGRSQPGSTR